MLVRQSVYSILPKSDIQTSYKASIRNRGSGVSLSFSALLYFSLAYFVSYVRARLALFLFGFANRIIAASILLAKSRNSNKMCFMITLLALNHQKWRTVCEWNGIIWEHDEISSHRRNRKRRRRSKEENRRDKRRSGECKDKVELEE